MKKLILKKRGFIALLIILSMVLTQCHKEFVGPLNSQFVPLEEQLIKKEVILKWIDNNLASKLLALDWPKATQTIVDGKKIVRIPTLDVDKLANLNLQFENNFSNMGIKSKTKKEPSITSSDNKNPNYYEEHPPEIFFVQKENSNELSAFLLNFVPDDRNKEFGKNNLWTGTLYEWNLHSDTMVVQNFHKNKIKDRYGLKRSSENKSLKIKVSDSKVQNLGPGNEISSGTGFFDWLFDKLGDVLGWFAGLLGLPTYWLSDHIGGVAGGVRIDWGAMVSGNNQTTTNFIAGEGIYGSYLPGIYNSPNWVPWQNGGPSDPDNGSAVVPLSVVFLSRALNYGNNSADFARMEFLCSNPATSNYLMTYLEAYGQSQTNLELVSWAVDYLQYNSFNLFQAGSMQILSLFKNLSLNVNQKSYLSNKGNVAISLTEILNQDSDYSENLSIVEAFIEGLELEENNPTSTTTPKSNDLTAKMKAAISAGVVATAILARKVYLSAEVLTSIPGFTAGTNRFVIDPMRMGALTMTDSNTQTMGWGDLCNMWLFELGPSSILINGNTNIQSGSNMSDPTTNALKNQSNILTLRNRIIDKLKDNTLGVNGNDQEYFTYNPNAYYASLVEQNIAKVFLGSFNAIATVQTKSSNSATVVFVINNTSSWESATRFIYSPNGNQGVISNKSRGAGLNIGGNFNQEIRWTETITW